MYIKIVGTITIDDQLSEFECSNEEAWFQWGATQERLSESVPIVEAISQALQDS